MSRTGKKPIVIPDGVDVKVEGDLVSVSGPHGELKQTIPAGIIVEQEDKLINVKRETESKSHRSLHGLTRTLIDNMVNGVKNKYAKTLELVGVGYRAVLQGDKLTLNVGLSHPVLFEAENNISIEVPSPTKIVVSGIDKQQVGNFTARIRRVAPPEPYKGKGIKYENEFIRKKVGKAGK